MGPDFAEMPDFNQLSQPTNGMNSICCKVNQDHSSKQVHMLLSEHSPVAEHGPRIHKTFICCRYTQHSALLYYRNGLIRDEPAHDSPSII